MTVTSTILTQSAAPAQGVPFSRIRAQAATAGLPTARALDPWHALVPSASRPGVMYDVTVSPAGELHCSCPNRGRSCWHVAAALPLLSVPVAPVPVPAPPALTREARAARARAAAEDLFGPEAA